MHRSASTNGKPAPAVEVHELRKEFSRRDKKAGRFVRKKRAALTGVTFTMERGECVAILGQNGSGKSTLVRLLSTLLFHDGGSAHVFGHDVFTEPRPVRRLVNRVSVEASFFKKLSAMENLLYGAKLYGVTSAEARPRIKEILDNIGFARKRATEPMEHLSRGMQQKIALARALLTSPVLMLLDEPTTGLDPRSKRDVQAFIQRIREAHDSSILLCTHDMGEAEELCDRVGIMMDGKILALEESEDLKRRYATNGHVPTMEETFMAATGYSVEEASAEEE